MFGLHDVLFVDRTGRKNITGSQSILNAKLFREIRDTSVNNIECDALDAAIHRMSVRPSVEMTAGL